MLICLKICIYSTAITVIFVGAVFLLNRPKTSTWVVNTPVPLTQCWCPIQKLFHRFPTKKPKKPKERQAPARHNIAGVQGLNCWLNLLFLGLQQESHQWLADMANTEFILRFSSYGNELCNIWFSNRTPKAPRKKWLSNSNKNRLRGKSTRPTYIKALNYRKYGKFWHLLMYLAAMEERKLL